MFLTFGVLFYFASHVFRWIRFYLIFIELDHSVRKSMTVYWPAALISFVLPFKLGEPLRIGLVGWQYKSISASLFLAGIERFFDFSVLWLYLVCTFFLFGPYQFPLLATLVALFMFFFVVIMLSAYFGLSPSLQFLADLTLSQSRTPKGAAFLSVLSRTQRFLDQIKLLIRFRGGLLLVISVLIWLFDFLGILFLSGLINIDPQVWTRLLIAVLSFNSGEKYRIVGIVTLSLFSVFALVGASWRSLRLEIVCKK